MALNHTPSCNSGSEHIRTSLQLLQNTTEGAASRRALTLCQRSTWSRHVRRLACQTSAIGLLLRLEQNPTHPVLPISRFSAPASRQRIVVATGVYPRKSRLVCRDHIAISSGPKAAPSGKRVGIASDTSASTANLFHIRSLLASVSRTYGRLGSCAILREKAAQVCNPQRT